jgi:predicted TIM-barrel fold metal-dependent hydrolase
VLFDADVHVHEHPPDLAPHCEMPWRLALEQEKGDDRWLDTPGYSPLTPLDPPLGDRPEPAPPFLRSADEARAAMDARGVDAALLITDRFVGLAAAQSVDYAVAIAAAYNRYLAERWLDPARGLYGAALLPGQDPAAAAEELRRCAERPGIVAGLLSTVNAYPLYGDRCYEPIWRAAEESGRPIVFHGATVYGTVFPYQLQQFEAASARGALSQPLGAIANLTSLVTNGVLTRHPGLKLLFCEAGLAWLPFLASRLDGQRRHLPDELPDLPSEQIRRQVWATTHPFDGALAGVSPDRVLFASDYPHYDHDAPDPGLTAQARGENARILLGL